MNWEDLKLFLTVSRHPKLEDAASHIGIDATTISRRIKRLEADLGRTLFERSRRGHKLTPEGDKLLMQVEKLESLSFDILSSQTNHQTMAGRVRIGAPEGIGSTVIARALTDFRRVHPGIDIDLIALSGLVSVPKRHADMSILLTRPTSGRLKVSKITDYTLHLYASKAFLVANDAIETTDSLQNLPLVGYTEDLIYSSQLRYLQDILPETTPHLCSPSIVAQYEMICSGAGVGILPDFMANRTDELVRLLPDQIEVERAFWLAIHEDVANLARIRAVADFLRRIRL